MQSDERDYFTDHSVLKDPYEYFEDLYSKCPVHQLKNRDILFVTGYQEAVEVLRNSRDFSSVMTPVGVAIPLPFEPKGDDISEQIEKHRARFRPPIWWWRMTATRMRPLGPFSRGYSSRPA